MTIDSCTRLFAVLGWPIRHSRSPIMQNAALVAAGIDAVYLALPVRATQLETVVAGLRGCGVGGVNLTVPHKRAGLGLCDSLTHSACAIGAVNTLEFCANGSVIGHNTDATGYVMAFEEEIGESVHGRRIVILGSGGAARAVACGAMEAGASSVSIVARNPEKVDWTDAADWNALTFEHCLPICDLLIDCTPIGLSSSSERQSSLEIDLGLLLPTAIVSDLVYHRKTRLRARARARGLRTVDGSGMLLFQGALAFEIWTGQSASIDAMRSALRCYRARGSSN